MASKIFTTERIIGSDADGAGLPPRARAGVIQLLEVRATVNKQTMRAMMTPSAIRRDFIMLLF